MSHPQDAEDSDPDVAAAQQLADLRGLLGLEDSVEGDVLDALSAVLTDAEVFDGLSEQESRQVAAQVAWLSCPVLTPTPPTPWCSCDGI